MLIQFNVIYDSPELKVGQMKREYKKPEFNKTAVTLLAVTAKVQTTGTFVDSSAP